KLMLELEDEIENQQEMLDSAVYDYGFDTLNVNSYVQIADLFFELGMERYGVTKKSGNITFPDESLEKIMENEPQLAELVRLIKNLKANRYALTNMSSVLNQSSETEYEGIGRVFPEYNQVDTNRIYWRNPNLSNL